MTETRRDLKGLFVVIQKHFDYLDDHSAKEFVLEITDVVESNVKKSFKDVFPVLKQDENLYLVLLFNHYLSIYDEYKGWKELNDLVELTKKILTESDVYDKLKGICKDVDSLDANAFFKIGKLGARVKKSKRQGLKENFKKTFNTLKFQSKRIVLKEPKYIKTRYRKMLEVKGEIERTLIHTEGDFKRSNDEFERVDDVDPQRTEYLELIRYLKKLIDETKKECKKYKNER